MLDAYREELSRIIAERNADRARRTFVKKYSAEFVSLRNLFGIDQTHMARLAGTNRQYIVWVENGRTKGMSAEAVQRILEAYEQLKELYSEGANGACEPSGASNVERPRR